MADDIIDQSFPYGEAASLAGAKFREVEALDSVTGQVWEPLCVCVCYNYILILCFYNVVY